MPCAEKVPIQSSSTKFFLASGRPSPAPAASPYHTEEPNINPKVPQIPSELTTTVCHINREPPADNQSERPPLDNYPQSDRRDLTIKNLLNPPFSPRADDMSRWPTLDNHSRSNTRDPTFKSLLNPPSSPRADDMSRWHTLDNHSRSNSPAAAAYHTEFAQGNEAKPNSSPSEAIFQVLLPIAELLTQPNLTKSPNRIYTCIQCYETYRCRGTLKKHVEVEHLSSIMFRCPDEFNAHSKSLPPVTCVCGRLVCSQKEYLLCFSNHCCTHNSVAWRAITASDPRPYILEQTINSFKSQINQEFPKLAHELVDRLARAQLRHFGSVIQNMENHAQAAVFHGCKLGDYCFTKRFPSQVLSSLFPEKLPGTFECPYCLRIQQAKTPSDWRNHIQEDMQFFTCLLPDCTGFMNKIRWFRHVSEVHHPSKRWVCKSCEYFSYQEANMYQHLIGQHKKSTCEALLDISSTYQYSRDKGAKEPCCFCGKVYYSWKGLQDHLMKHMKHIASLLLL